MHGILGRVVHLWHKHKNKQLRACSHGGGGPRVGEVSRLGGVTNLSTQFLFSSWLSSHERWGTSPGGLPGQPGRVTRLGGVSFLHVNAEGGVPHLTGVMFIWASTFLVWKIGNLTPALRGF